MCMCIYSFKGNSLLMESLRKKRNANGSKLYISHISRPYSYISINSDVRKRSMISLICLILQDKAVSYESSDPCRGLVCITLYQPASTELGDVCGEMHWKDDSTASSVVLGRLRAHCWEIGLYLSVSQSTDPSLDCETLLTGLDGRDLSPGTDLTRIKQQRSGDGQGVE